ncbi:hypothetical protein [Plesiomonas shigelloides]|uniref:hypothetical protein n=1 Tax=Plesiomonas shigelloides TaxID=703 RepID=UPI0012621B0F|nr:hypothetical protein [Plesiomonas shigelloides]KAB7669164.1 hypothetical protein GBN25_02715 [Plesiomonas shigelloides]
MTQLLGVKIFRTINIPIHGQMYTIHFAESGSDRDNFIFVRNDDTGKQSRFEFSKETVDDYKKANDEDLTQQVLAIIGGEVVAGRI